MYVLKRFNEARFDRLTAIVDSLAGHITGYVNLVGSATLPLPVVCEMAGLPATACRVEGHLDARLFPATEPIDQAEALIEEHTRRLFRLDSDYDVHTQPHSATTANHVILRAILTDDSGPVAGLSPADGGHISHQFGVPAPHEFVPLPIDRQGLDSQRVAELVRSARPSIIVAGGSSYSRAIEYEQLREIADHVGAHLHADLAHTAPFVAARLHPPAFPFVDSATIDPSKNLRGSGGGILVARRRDAKRVRRAVFPLLQSAPSQIGLLSKAACLAAWSETDLAAYASRMVSVARRLSERLEPTFGAPLYGGTDTHLVLFDVSACREDGRQVEDELAAAHILVNRNLLPGDQRSPWRPSGVRLSSTVPTILGYPDEDVDELARAIQMVLRTDEGHVAIVDRLLETHHSGVVSTASGPTSEAPT